MTNCKLFYFSIKNVSERFDPFNVNDFVVVSKTKSDIPTDLMVDNKKLLKLIEQYAEDNNIINQNLIIKKIIDIICNSNSKINYSPLLIYLQVLNYSANDFVYRLKKSNINEKIDLTKKLLDSYIKNRHTIYKLHGYSDSMLQVRADLTRSRLNSMECQSWFVRYFTRIGIKKAQTFDEFINCEESYIFPDRGQHKIFFQFLFHIKYKYDFHQQKKPDVILKLKRKFYIIEHKKVNSCGGHQDAQINELINFITLSHRDISFISFLSGEYFNKFRANSSKIKCQKKRNTKKFAWKFSKLFP